MGIARRSITSVGWNVLTSPILLIIQIVRSVLLARLLPVGAFGIYAWASSLVGFSMVFANFGMGGAFLHRADETQIEEDTAAVHFTLKFIFSSVWAIIMGIGAWYLTEEDYRVALLSLIVIQYGISLSETPILILTRRVVHRRLALIKTLDVIISAIMAVVLAWNGLTLGALLATNIVSLVLNVSLLFLWRPVWRPHFAWIPNIVRYFLNFGSRNLLAQGLLKALNEVDDLWTGIFLGKESLGFYSRAYTFATYPRKILAIPINVVASGTYAELKDDRIRLSQAFFRTNALLIRVGFLLAGLLALVAPELITLVLTDKWLPMLDAFRLMLVFIMLDPIKSTIANLFTAVGKPQHLIPVRSVQLIILVVGLLALGPSLGIGGVALAVNLMLIVGIFILLRKVQEYVDFSMRKLFLVPLTALILGLIWAQFYIYFPVILSSDWNTLIAKTILFVPLYGCILLLFERRATLRMINIIVRILISEK